MTQRPFPPSFRFLGRYVLFLLLDLLEYVLTFHFLSFAEGSFYEVLSTLGSATFMKTLRSSS